MPHWTLPVGWLIWNWRFLFHVTLAVGGLRVITFVGVGSSSVDVVHGVEVGLGLGFVVVVKQGVEVGVGVGVLQGVDVGVGVGVLQGVDVGVGFGVGVSQGVDVGVGVGVGVLQGVDVGVAGGAGPCPSQLTLKEGGAKLMIFLALR